MDEEKIGLKAPADIMAAKRGMIERRRKWVIDGFTARSEGRALEVQLVMINDAFNEVISKGVYNGVLAIHFLSTRLCQGNDDQGIRILSEIMKEKEEQWRSFREEKMKNVTN